MPGPTLFLDVLIFGGGIAGLWTLDECVRRGWQCLLLESVALGSGQTAASQGIIHGGLKYMLDGRLTPAARAIADMPDLWRQCLAGTRDPHLTNATVGSDACYLWGTGSLKSRLLLKGAHLALRTHPELLEPSARPAALARVPGEVLRVPEQVIDPLSVIRSLASRHADRILHFDSSRGPAIESRANASLSVTVHPPDSDRMLVLEPIRILFAAGEGNAELRRRAGLPEQVMQRRPLHMVMLRGALPELFGHCISGSTPRVTITTATDAMQRRVWQVGGQLAERGVDCDAVTLLDAAKHEFADVLPGLDLKHAEFAAYRITRAEAATSTGQRPDDVHLIEEARILTVWPTKFALAPRLSQLIVERIAPSIERDQCAPPSGDVLSDWPKPPLAKPPWETCNTWSSAS
ncbi:MAG TPA: FAD-dependent oxidoreductase [Phycisphaerae bacterium]|jgi:glycine/D-amino acid oxidase-like deaminating enzyme